jgi:heme O synthase-like polyprenyltransferase
LLAGLSKLPRRREFANAVERYQLLPDRLVPLVARVVPVAELLAGAALLLGLGLQIVAALVALMLAAFTVAVSTALLRGREIDCGCFSGVSPTRITWLTVGRNGVLLLFAALLSWQAPRALALDDIYLEDVAGAGASASDALAVLIASTAALASYALVRTSFSLQRLSSRQSAERNVA